MNRRIIVTAALALAACAPQYTVKPANKTDQEFAADKADCSAKAGAAGSAFTTANAGTAVDVRNETMRNCMMGKGYKEDK